MSRGQDIGRLVRGSIRAFGNDSNPVRASLWAPGVTSHPGDLDKIATIHGRPPELNLMVRL